MAPQVLQTHSQEAPCAFNEDVFDSILFNADLHALSLFNLTSHVTRSRIRAHIGHRISRAFQPFVDDVPRFQKKLQKTKSVVSGSIVLVTARPASWTPSDMDIYTPSGESEPVIQHLVQVEGYNVIKESPSNSASAQELGADEDPAAHGPDEDEDEDDARSLSSEPYGHSLPIIRVVRLQRTPPAAHLGPPRFIEVIESCAASAVFPIGQFLSTFVMNWITGDGEIHVLHPRLTLVGVGLMNGTVDGPMAEKQQRWREKYERRGYVAHDSTSALAVSCGASCPARARRAGDAKCLVVSANERKPSTGGGGAQQDTTLPVWHLTGWKVAGDQLATTCMNQLCANFGAQMGSAGLY